MIAACSTDTRTMEQENINNPPTATETPAPVDWAALVDNIRAGDPGAMEELYALFARGIRFYFYRQLGAQELDDKIHDTFLIVVQAIRRGDLREPERLMGFVRTIVRRQVAAHIDQVVHVRREETSIDQGAPLPDHSHSPEDRAMKQEKLDVMARTLRSMSSRDREILTRFYLQEQTQEQICAEMRLTDTQFRLLKSRAKARFGEMGRRRLEKAGPTQILARIFPGRRH
jgi:RNA polymerase sigma-70 factor, ECF subfamily